MCIPNRAVVNEASMSLISVLASESVRAKNGFVASQESLCRLFATAKHRGLNLRLAHRPCRCGCVFDSPGPVATEVG